MRRLKWISGIVLTLLLIAGGSYVARLIWFRPVNVDHFFSRVAVQYALEDPMIFDRLKSGLLQHLSPPNPRIQYPGPALQEERIRFFRENLETVERYLEDDREGEQYLNLLVLQDYLRDQLLISEFSSREFPFSPGRGAYAEVIRYLCTEYPYDDLATGESYLSRLRELADFLEQARAASRSMRDHGYVPARPLIRRVADSLRSQLSHPAEKHLLYRSFARRLVRLDPTQINDTESVSLLSQAAEIIEDDLKPEWAKTIALLDSLVEIAPEAWGLRHQKEGKLRYRNWLRYETGSDASPDSVLAWGMKLTDYGRRQLEKLNIGDRETETGVARDQQKILADAWEILNRGAELSSGLFESANRRVPLVRPLPAFLKPFLGRDLMRSNISPLGKPELYLDVSAALPLHQLKSLCFRQGIPGRTLVLEQGLESELPAFRSLIHAEGFLRGWELYADRLMAESLMLYAGDTTSLRGHYELLRMDGVRAVLDVGVHVQGWSAEDALATLEVLSGLEKAEILDELIYVAGNPGAGSAAVTGYHDILKLRDAFQSQNGADFALQDFHRQVLQNAALPPRVLMLWFEKSGGRR